MNEIDFSGAGSIEQLCGLLEQAGMGPGWSKPEPAMWASPNTTFVPAHWRYELARPALDRAGKFVSTELAERRNLILFNPVRGNSYATARTLIAAYQMVMAGETARSHRHSPNALRLVTDAAPGAYTVVDGKRIPMLPGDVLLTPNWSWHGHRNESSQCAYWIDFLDAPLVQLLEPMFFEQLAGGIERADEIDAHSPMRFSFEEVRRRLETQAESAPGRREVRLGPPYLETMALQVSRLDPGAAVAASRSTANAIFAVIDGNGRSAVENSEFEWGRGDVFVVPSWHRHRCQARTASYLLRVSDEPLMQLLGWLRQE